jgi:hypothetical protein
LPFTVVDGGNNSHLTNIFFLNAIESSTFQPPLEMVIFKGGLDFQIPLKNEAIFDG